MRFCNSPACLSLTFVGLDQRSDGASVHAEVGNNAMNVA